MRKNILLAFCRRTNHHQEKEVASELGITVSLYREIENGDVPLTYRQARKLAKFYSTKPHYFYAAVQQLEFLQSCEAIIQTLTAENDRLREQLADLKKAWVAHSRNGSDRP